MHDADRSIPTTIEVVDDEMARVLRAKTGAERLQIAFGLYSSARRMLLSALRAEHPDWDDDRIHREAARRLSHGPVDVQLSGCHGHACRGRAERGAAFDAQNVPSHPAAFGYIPAACCRPSAM